MATMTAHPTPAMPASRWPYLLAYLAAVIAAEVLIAIPGATPLDRPFQSVGLGIHILLVFTLMFLSVLIQPKDATLAPLLVAASLASLVRVFSLAVPRYPFFTTPETNPLNTIPWLALVSVPLLVSVAAVAYVQRLRPRGLWLARHRRPEGAQPTANALTGVPPGLGVFFIPRPARWVAQPTGR